jgi:exo-beta-1,3-glucanase (GH17 family)
MLELIGVSGINQGNLNTNIKMNTYKELGINPGRAICYSGFREGHRPGGTYPSYAQVKEDLMILQYHWKYLRLFDCDRHAKTVLDVIKKEKFDFQVMLGAYIEAEMNNFNCPWDGGIYTKEQLEINCRNNRQKISELIDMANQYPDIIFSLSVGNEACVEWTDHFVSENKVTEYAAQVKEEADQPVTFCENYVPWLIKLDKLASVLDFISIHTYPVWEYKHIGEAIDYTKENYYSVANKYPDNGRGINPNHVNEDFQKIYFENLMKWTEEENILTFFFEAFDEEWKGSPEPLEPEKHWGLFKIDRTPKLVMKTLMRLR